MLRYKECREDICMKTMRKTLLDVPKARGSPLLKPQECAFFISYILEPADLVKTSFQTLASVESQTVPSGELYVCLRDNSKQ